MIYSKYCEYVVKALAYLHEKHKTTPYVMVREIAEHTKIPLPFLSKIFQDLGTTKWVNTKKGKKGGVSLAVDANKIKLIDIIKWSDGLDNFNRCLLGTTICGRDLYCQMHKACSSIRNELVDFFTTTTIKDVSEMHTEEEHIIKPKRGKRYIFKETISTN
jgi:Rrf2 family protein